MDRPSHIVLCYWVSTFDRIVYRKVWKFSGILESNFLVWVGSECPLVDRRSRENSVSMKKGDTESLINKLKGSEPPRASWRKEISTVMAKEFAACMKAGV